MDEFGAYTADGTTLQTRNSVCAYLDVLGFTAEVRKADAAGTADEFLSRFGFVVQNWFTSLGDIFAIETGEPRRREYRIFTDNVIVGEPVHTGAELAFAISDVALLQMGLISEGFFARGGVSVGRLYISDDIVYGVATLDAHDAEQSALWPRVILHDTAQAAVQQEVTYYRTTYGESRGHRFTDALLVDEDGKWFVDYLTPAVFPGAIFEPHYSSLELHAEVVQKRLSEHKSDSHVLEKYIWVARYHNYFCSSIDAQSYAINIDRPILAVTAI